MTLQAQKAASHAHGNGGGAPGCIAPGGPRRNSSDDGARLSAAETGTPARVQQVQCGLALLCGTRMCCLHLYNCRCTTLHCPLLHGRLTRYAE
jgi:hypothetical protein